MLRRLPRNEAARIRTKMIAIAEDPYASHPEATRLVGRDAYRLRIGDWQVLYEIVDEAQIVRIAGIVSRGQAYR